MNVLKNFEAVFVVALCVAVCAGSLAPSSGQMSAAASPAHGANVATPTKMAVVTVTGKRMSVLEKQRSLEDERRLAKQGVANGSRI